jgi:hypothetical protein
MNKLRVKRALQAVLAALLICSIAQVSFPYAVLTHEAIIDSTWDSDLKPLLLKRFPDSSVDQLREAHAYAYGGSIIQDMGYYPFSSKFFSDLAHYVRSGDFVQALIRDSQDINEYAFALGALCHYSADTDGHPIATNRSVPILYPKLRRRYGDSVTYDQNPAAHLQTEFGFDVIQVAHGHFAPESYHDFIGFKVSKPLLERAFKETYDIELKSIFTDLDLALGTYRYSVSTLIPEMTKVAWQTHKDELEKETPGMTLRKFRYRLPTASYRKEWGTQYQKPGFFAKVLSVIFRVIPKVGPFKAFAIKPSTPETEKLFVQSFKATIDNYRALLKALQVGNLDLQNKDFDTGKPTAPGEYQLADKTYAKLLGTLAAHNFENLTPDLQHNILSFYGDTGAHIATKKDQNAWQTTLRELAGLKSAATHADPAQPGQSH